MVVEFICELCGDHVYAVGKGPDEEKVCEICRFIRANPDIPVHIKAALLYEGEK